MMSHVIYLTSFPLLCQCIWTNVLLKTDSKNPLESQLKPNLSPQIVYLKSTLHTEIKFNKKLTEESLCLSLQNDEK